MEQLPKEIKPIRPNLADWHYAIGLFILEFGHLEYLIFVFLEDSLAPEEFAKSGKLHLKDRLLTLHSYAKSAQRRSQLQSWTARLNPIRELRNDIAHGHLHLSGLGPGETPRITFFASKYIDNDDSPGAKRLTYEDLRRALDSLAQLKDEFYRLTDQWRFVVEIQETVAGHQRPRDTI